MLAYETFGDEGSEDGIYEVASKEGQGTDYFKLRLSDKRNGNVLVIKSDNSYERNQEFMTNLE